MKHILPILTLALLGAAATASASTFYYDYYLSYSNNDPVDNKVTVDGKEYRNQSDVPTYGTITSFNGDGVTVSEDNTFTAHRESNWGNDITGANPNNFFRIELGSENTQKVNLYLTDFVSSIYGSDPYYNSDSNALFNDTYDNEGNITKRAIVEYGYRTLTLNEETGKYEAGETKRFSTVIEDSEGKIEIEGTDGVKTYRLNTANVTELDKISVNDWNEPVARYQYSLGAFDPGDVIEVYMKDSVGGEVYSFSSNVNGEYQLFDKTSPVLDENDEILDKSQGGFSDGGYVVGSTETDAMLYNYYFNENISKSKGDYHDYTVFDSDKTIAAEKAMPLSQLIPNYYTSEGLVTGKAVAFGIYGKTFGSPLPGGLQIALIAGLFGLGFCYIRRRKAIVG